MADVFISYAKKHAQLTQDLARDLEAEGFTTWWDTSLLPGDEFPEQIRQEIDAAQAVIVIWTESSVASQWVRAEANRAHGQGKLITLHAPGLSLDTVPLPFNTLQSSLVTDRTKVFAALARRGVRPGNGAMPPAPGADLSGSKAAHSYPPPVDSGFLAIAAAEWEHLKEAADLGKLKRFAQHFAGTYYAELAEERILLREERAREEAERKRRNDEKARQQREAEVEAKAELAKKVEIDAAKREQEAWKNVFSRRSVALAETFIKEFPASEHAVEAQNRVKFLTKFNNKGASIGLVFFIIFWLSSIAFLGISFGRQSAVIIPLVAVASAVSLFAGRVVSAIWNYASGADAEIREQEKKYMGE